MIKHRKDGDAMAQAYSVIREKVEQQEMINEKGGLWDKALAKSPLAKAFGGVSQRAAGRVTSKNDSKQLLDRFYSTLGRNNKPVSKDQFTHFLTKQIPSLNPQMLPVLQGIDPNEMLKPRQIKKMMPELVDQAHEIIAGGSSTAGVEDVDPNSVFSQGDALAAAGAEHASQAAAPQAAAPQAAAPQAAAPQAAAPQAAAPQAADIEGQLQDKQEELTDDDPETPEEVAALKAEMEELRAELAAVNAQMKGKEPGAEPEIGSDSGGGKGGSMVSKALEKPAQELPGQLTGEDPGTEAPTEEPARPTLEPPKGFEGMYKGEEPAVEEPAVEEPAVEEPPAEEPAVEEPAGEETANAGLQAAWKDVSSRLGPEVLNPPDGQGPSEEEFKAKYPEEYQKLVAAGWTPSTPQDNVDKLTQAVQDRRNEVEGQKFPDDGGPFAQANPDRVEKKRLPGGLGAAISDKQARDQAAEEPAGGGGYDPEAPYGGGAAQATVDRAEQSSGGQSGPGQFGTSPGEDNRTFDDFDEPPDAAPADTAPAKRKKTGGRVKGQLSQTPSAIKRRENRARKKAESAPAKKKSKAPAKKKTKLSKANKDAIADSPFANVKYERYNVLARSGFMSDGWGNF